MTRPALQEAILYRNAGEVKRYHTKRTLRQQTVAEHTFGVLMLIKQVSEGCTDIDFESIAKAALHHDLPELFTGDIPAPIKRAHPTLGPLMDTIESDMTPLYQDQDHLSVEEHALLKWADRMELVLWCMEEHKMGNTYCGDMVRRALGWILASPIPHCAKELTDDAVVAARSMGLSPASSTNLERYA